VRDLPRSARDIIRGLQPFMVTNPAESDAPKSHWLYQLHRLWNDDKHRHLTFIGLSFGASQIRANSTSPILDFQTRGSPIRDLQDAPADISREYRVACEDGAIIARITPEIPDAEMHVEAQSHFVVAFGPETAFSGAVVETLSVYYRLIEEEIFAKFMPLV
jgi:hypothetical protein